MSDKPEIITLDTDRWCEILKEWDLDQALEEVCIILIRRHVEIEMGGRDRLASRAEWLGTAHDPNAPDELNDHGAEIEAIKTALAVYDWAAGCQAAEDALLAMPGGEDRWNAELAMDERATEMMKTLVSIRGHLWI